MAGWREANDAIPIVRRSVVVYRVFVVKRCKTGDVYRCVIRTWIDISIVPLSICTHTLVLKRRSDRGAMVGIETMVKR